MSKEKTIKDIYKDENYKIEEINKENFFSAEGRITRSTYLTRCILIWIVITFLYSLLKGLILTENMADWVTNFISITILISYILLIIQIVKRLHDVNEKGSYWLVLLIPLANLIGGLYLIFKDGTIGENEYGPDLKNRKVKDIYNKDNNLEINKIESREDIIKGIKNRYIISILFMIIFLICFIIAIINLINNFTWGLLIINLVIFAFIIFLLERFVSMKEEFDSYKGLNKENIEMKRTNTFKYCSKCGQKISNKDKFCTKCGNKIK